MMPDVSSRQNQIIIGDCIQVLKTLPEKSVDLVFADPPYNLQLEKELWRPNATRVNGVDEVWDQFANFESYDRFTEEWLERCRRILKDTGTIWVIGSYHNIFRVGRILQDLGFWILNDIVWIKNNPMPNFHGVRFTNAHETLIWAQKIKGNKYTFNYQVMKSINRKGESEPGVQMRSDWRLPLCTGKERLKINGEKAHPTQKPEALLERVLLASSNPGDMVLDPFFGTGTTGAVAKRLGRKWIGIELNPGYASIAQKRICTVEVDKDNHKSAAADHRLSRIRVPFSALVRHGVLREGEALYFGPSGECKAHITSNGQLQYGDTHGSIHQLGRELSNAPCNGWLAWYYIDVKTGKREPIDRLRKMVVGGVALKSDDLQVESEEL